MVAESSADGKYYFIGVDGYFATPEEAEGKFRELESILMEMGVTIEMSYKTMPLVYASIRDSAAVEELTKRGYTVSKAPERTLHI